MTSPSLDRVRRVMVEERDGRTEIRTPSYRLQLDPSAIPHAPYAGCEVEAAARTR